MPKLEALGLKPFASKALVSFVRSIASAAGPSGCGKASTVGSACWHLGEQRSSMLRSDKMESVALNGARSKKPAGAAEASLAAANDKGALPAEPSEATIARRAFGSGESECLLNKNACHLKGVASLFVGAGASRRKRALRSRAKSG